jgi:hypothetical protein
MPYLLVAGILNKLRFEKTIAVVKMCVLLDANPALRLWRCHSFSVLMVAAARLNACLETLLTC